MLQHNDFQPDRWAATHHARSALRRRGRVDRSRGASMARSGRYRPPNGRIDGVPRPRALAAAPMVVKRGMIVCSACLARLAAEIDELR
jgi:hypothetical protein